MGNFSYTLYLSHRIVLMWIFCFVFPLHKGDMSLYNMIIYLCINITCLIICWCISLFSEKYTPQIKTVLKRKLLKSSMR